MVNRLKFIPAKIKPIFLTLIILFGFVFLLPIGYRKIQAEIKSLQKERKDLLKNENILKEKEAVLLAAASKIDQEKNLAYFALPSKNSTLSALFQIKKIATEIAVSFSHFEIGGVNVEKNGLNRVSLLIGYRGQMLPLFAFLTDLKTIAPLVRIESFDLNFLENDLVEADLNLVTFWAPEVSKLPNLTQPVLSLTEADQEILNTIESLKAPPFLNFTPNLFSEENLSPFGL